MRMLVVIAVLAAGCGDWSNADLAFSNALPFSVDLRSKMPAGSQPIQSVALGGPSPAWARTRQAANDFNGLLEALLGLVDQARQSVPTSRTSDSRTWGPFDDTSTSGRQVQLVVKQLEGDRFEWHIDSRPNSGEFVPVVSGEVVVSAIARRGHGSISVVLRDLREVVAVDDRLAELDVLRVEYATDAVPAEVKASLTLKPGSTSALSREGYVARSLESGAGGLRFGYQDDARHVSVSSVWNATGEGQAVGEAFTECWSKSFIVVRAEERWDGGVTVGSASDCAAVEGL